MKIGVFENFGFLKISNFFHFVRKYFGFFGVFVKEIVIFNIGFGFCVLNSIWEHRLKIFFDPKKSKKSTPRNRKKSQKCEQFSYETFGGIFWDFCKEVHTRPGPTCAPYIYIYIDIYVYIYI